MKMYPVQIKETLIMTVKIEAENAAQAREIVERNWKNGDNILDASHFENVTFTIPQRSARER